MASRGDVLARRALLRTRVRRGDARAALALARSLERDAPRDHGAARRAYEAAAEAGLADAQLELAEMLRDGRGGRRDLREALRWLEAAARAGNPRAAHALGEALFHGEGAARDRAAAVRLYRRAARAGLGPAMFELGLALRAGDGVRRDEAAALRWLRRAADRGHPRAAYEVGQAYWWGRHGAPRDRARAAPFLLAAARRGDPDGMVRIALSRRDGEGLARSSTSAIAWARRAAEAGSARGRKLLRTLQRARPDAAPRARAPTAGSTAAHEESRVRVVTRSRSTRGPP